MAEQQSGSVAAPYCQRPPQPRVMRALLCLAWRQPRADRPGWLRAEVGEASDRVNR